MKKIINKKIEEYQIIVLGKNCFPRVLLTEYNLIKTKAQGRMSMPFDLASHSVEILIRHLESDFSFYYDGIEINKETKEIENKLTGSIYPHDKNCLDIDKLKSRYDNRIENFRNALKNDTFIFFVIFDEYKDGEIEKLYTTLCKIRKEDTFKLIVWNYAENSIDVKNDNISVFNKPLPQKEWKWDEEEVKKQKFSIDYKTAIINFTKNVISETGFKVVLYKLSFIEKFIVNIKKITKWSFSVSNDNDKKMKYMCICGIKFKIKDLK